MSVPSWARVGAKVVCVDFRPGAHGEPCPMQPGTAYTIASVYQDFAVEALFLVEVEFIWYGRPLPFGIERFRPLVEPKTEAEDVALFISHLKAPTATTRERADV